jgi:hypothetical protein
MMSSRSAGFRRKLALVESQLGASVMLYLRK